MSAFNWRYKLLRDGGGVSFHLSRKEELKIIEKYGSANALAEKLHVDPSARKDMCLIGHVCEDVNWYLTDVYDGDFLDKHHQQFLFVGTTENFRQ